MKDATPDTSVVQALRRDVAFQLARFARSTGLTQIAAAKRLGLPQPTLSKIINGRVSDLSLELLIRAAARAGLPMTLQIGRVPQEAGAFVSATHSGSTRTSRSLVGDESRDSVNQSVSRLTPTERLHAFLEHNAFVGALHQAGRNSQPKS